MSIEFTTGNFVKLRATTSFHLGQIERDISKDEIVEYDGVTIKFGDASHNISAIRAAIKAGWLVPNSDTVSVYRPVAAGVQVHSAISLGRERSRGFATQTVHEEDRNLGDLKAVRDRGDGIVRKIAVVQADASSEGVPVGKINRPTHTKSVITPENEMRLAQEIRRVDNIEGTPDKRVSPIRASHDEFASAEVVGNTSGAKAGDAISDLLGDDEGVVVARLPPIVNTNPLGEGDSPHLTAIEKAERRSVNQKAVDTDRAARIAAANASAGKLGVGPDAQSSIDQTSVAEVLPADLAQKVQFVRAVIPTFEWDMTRPWKTRVMDAVKRYGKNPLYLNGILSVETDTVKNSITQALSKP